MTVPKEPPASALAWAAKQVGDAAPAVVIKGLREGGSPWLLRYERDGRPVDVVLKTAHPTHRDGLVTEIAALRLAEVQGIPAPRILGIDTGGRSAGAPALLETAVPGRPTIPVDPAPARLRGLGAAAALVHAASAEVSPELPLRTRPIPASDFARDRRAGADHSTPLLAAADEVIRARPVPAGRSALVHGDLWQGNIMWQGEALSALLDWEMAGVGHYGVDLGSLRLDAALMFGQEAAGPVLAGWEEATGQRAEDVAYWDAVAALNMPGDMALFLPVIHDQGRVDLTAATLNERRDTFLEAALNRLR